MSTFILLTSYYYFNSVRYQLTHSNEEGGRGLWSDSNIASVVTNISVTERIHLSMSGEVEGCVKHRWVRSNIVPSGLISEAFTINSESSDASIF